MDGKDKYIAVTHFCNKCTFVGEPNVSNEYYFVGQNSAIGPAPTDTFTVAFLMAILV